MDFCFSTYVSELKAMYYETISDEDLVNLLIKHFVDLVDLKTKDGEIYYLEKKQVSRLITRKRNVPSQIRSVLEKNIYNEKDFFAFFEKKIYNKLIPNKVEVKCNLLMTTLSSSSELSETIKSQLLELISNKNFSNFLAVALELAITSFPNKIQQLSDDELVIKSESVNLDKKANFTVPAEIQSEEQPYITAIIDAISEKEKQEMSIETINTNKKYKERLTRHRTEYFSADYVRRQSREIYDENEDPFDDLQEELKDGIIYTVEKTNYENGYERLNATLEQAAQVQLDSNKLVKETDFVNMKAKQGLCHTLVNDEKLPGWTNDKYN